MVTYDAVVVGGSVAGSMTAWELGRRGLRVALLDKARAHVHTGRYKLALASLVKVTDPKPEQLVQIALIKGKSQGALGRTEEALKTLTDTTKVQLKGKPDTTIAQHPKTRLPRVNALGMTTTTRRMVRRRTPSRRCISSIRPPP